MATLPSNSFNPAVSGQAATPDDWNETASDIESMLSTSIATNGVSTISANLPLSGFKFTNVGNASARTQFGAVGQIQDGTFEYAASSGASAYTATMTPAIVTLVTGMQFRIKIGTTNPIAAPTLSVNGTTAKTIINNDGSALLIKQLIANGIYNFTYDGTNYRVTDTLVSPLTTQGDLWTRTASSNTRVAIGAANTVLRSDGTDPSWGKVLFADIDSDFIADASAVSTAVGDYMLIMDASDSNESKRALASYGNTYTPTLTGVANVTTASAFTCFYVRVSDFVMVWGVCNVLTAASSDTQTTLGISLPIASNLAAATDLSGPSGSTNSAQAGGITGDTTNDRAQLDFVATVAGNKQWAFQFGYRVL